MIQQSVNTQNSVSYTLKTK